MGSDTPRRSHVHAHVCHSAGLRSHHAHVWHAPLGLFHCRHVFRIREACSLYLGEASEAQHGLVPPHILRMHPCMVYSCRCALQLPCFLEGHAHGHRPMHFDQGLLRTFHG